MEAGASIRRWATAEWMLPSVRTGKGAGTARSGGTGGGGGVGGGGCGNSGNGGGSGGVTIFYAACSVVIVMYYRLVQTNMGAGEETVVLGNVLVCVGAWVTG